MKHLDYDVFSDIALLRVKNNQLYNKRRNQFLSALKDDMHLSFDDQITPEYHRWWFDHCYLLSCHASQNLILSLAYMFDPTRKWSIQLTQGHDFVVDLETSTIFDPQSAKAAAIIRSTGKQITNEDMTIAASTGTENESKYLILLEPGKYLHPDFNVQELKKLIKFTSDKIVKTYMELNQIDMWFCHGQLNIPKKYLKPFPFDLNLALNYVKNLDLKEEVKE